MRKIFIIMLLFLLMVSLNGCRSNKDVPTPEEIVNIKSLNAEKISSVQSSTKKNRLKVINEQEEHEHRYSEWVCVVCGYVNPDHVHRYIDGYCELCGIEAPHEHTFIYGKCECGEDDPNYIVEGLIEKGQYVVMYKSETDFSFTITLDNPKGESIDAIELTCDDPNSQILMDGKYEKIQYNNGAIIVNWSQENPYYKTYQIRTTSKKDVNSLKIVDIKVNGKWQQKELKNDELKIYKINDNDLKWNFITNTEKYYKWSFTYNENKISNIEVTANGDIINPDEDGIYTINKNSIVCWNCDININEESVKFENQKNIELFKIEYPTYEYHMNYFTYQLVRDSYNYLVQYVASGFYLRGTDIDLDPSKYEFVVLDTLLGGRIEVNIANMSLQQMVFVEYPWVLTLSPKKSIPSNNYDCYGDVKVEIYINGYYAGKLKSTSEYHNDILYN